jgi:putative transposase
MNFEKEHLYHIYNQGNNRIKIFYSHENYLFFLTKLRDHIIPYADILAWCLMPNHFHLMIKFSPKEHQNSLIDLNKSIGIMLRSYTRAINKQEGFSGSLFRQKTKAECITCLNGITPSFYSEENSTRINYKDPSLQYPQICFNYIHNNPVKAGLCIKTIDWEYSSAKDHANLRNGALVNKKVAKEYVEI